MSQSTTPTLTRAGRSRPTAAPAPSQTGIQNLDDVV